MPRELSEAEQNERLHNLNRFTQYRYQLKGSGGGDGILHSAQNEIVSQVPGCYPYPVGDSQEFGETEEEEKPDLPYYHNGNCFKPQKLI